MSRANALLPGSLVDGRPVTLGVLGGGQLGRMFVQAAQAMGYHTAVLDPDPASPAGLISHVHVKTDYLSEAGLAQMLQCCHAITTEFENVPAQALATLGAQRRIAPDAAAVAIAQDRRREKAHFARCGVQVAPYAVIESEVDCARVAPELLPGILKTAQLGYDGKGQRRVGDAEALRAAWLELGSVPCVLEQQLALADELSVIVARGADGACVHLPVQRNTHRDGILAVTQVFEGNCPAALAAQAVAATESIAHGLQYVGVLCVEFFVLTDGRLLANEMAPRPRQHRLLRCLAV